jgi:hypothetical protein
MVYIIPERPRLSVGVSDALSERGTGKKNDHPQSTRVRPAHTERWVPPLPPHPTPPPNPSSDPSCRTRIELQPGLGQFVRQRPFRIQQLDVVGTADRNVVEQDVWNCVTAC